MTRICTKCLRSWVSLKSEETKVLPLCPTCAAGMKPLSRLRAERKGEKRTAPPPELEIVGPW